MIFHAGLRHASACGSCIAILLVGITALVLLAALSRGCGGGSMSVNPLPGDGWTVGGVSLRDSVDALKVRLGPPSDEMGPPDHRTLRFRHGDVVVNADAAGRVFYVWSTSLMQHADTRLSAGASEDEVRTALGDSRAVKHYRPKGGGIITTGYTHDSTTFTYRLGPDDLTIHVYEGTVRGISATVSSPLPPLPGSVRASTPLASPPGSSPVHPVNAPRHP